MTAPGYHPAAMAPPQPPMSFPRAMRRTPFAKLVLVEFRKLSGTLSDRILLIVGPLVLIGANVLLFLNMDNASDMASARDQITPTFYLLRIGHVIIHAALIKLIAGEWQHRAAQPTLLAQPSRGRYFLAQATVVFVLWVFCATLQTILTLTLSPVAAANSGVVYLLSYRVGWVIGVCFLGSLLTMLVALTVAMLVPNAAGALAIYFATVPAMLTISGLAPKVFAWFDPSTPAATLATLSAIDGPVPSIVSLLVWLGLLGFAGYRVSRRDLA
ncbi:hypothetical protein [Amycolatopsis sp. NPDC059657]|uniref:hypothetical protein n=1 Tax=Amycolatopsis sp. NPDC059657 TaxID=3346899 RepID=UPI00366ABA61